MTTPKQRLISILQKNFDLQMKSICTNFYLTEEQTDDFLNIMKEQELAAEVVTNAYVLNMTDEELEDYVSAVEKMYMYQDKLGSNISQITSDVVTRFMEHNNEVLSKMIQDNIDTLEDIE